MKQILVFCAVLSAAAVVASCASESDLGFNIFARSLDIIDDDRITDEQKKCIQNGYKQVVEANPNLSSWFDDIEKTSQNLTEYGKQCKELAKPQQKRCFHKLRRLARAEFHRLFGNLTEEQKNVLNELKTVVEECLKEESEETQIDIAMDDDDLDIFGAETTRLTPEQIECIKEGIKKVVEDNPELNEWFEDVQTTLKKLAGNAEECSKLSGIKQVKCYANLIATARDEIRRLLEQLSEEQKQILQELKNVVKECVANGNAL